MHDVTQHRWRQGVLRRFRIVLLATLVPVAGCGSGDTGRAADHNRPTPTSMPTSAPTSAPSGTETALRVRDVQMVRPPADSPLATIDRDAGVSVVLSDGSLLWLFGDTAARDDSGDLDYFVIGSASWASADAPTVTNDHPNERFNRPDPFVATDQLAPCDDPAFTPGAWPLSAVVERVGERDRVVVWFSNVCLGESTNAVSRGIGVSEWWYDPNDPPRERSIVATVLNPRLFASDSFGGGAIRQPDGTVVVYGCAVAALECRAATVSLDSVADPSAYQPWDGAAFAAGGAPAALPIPESKASFPVGGFSISYEPGLERYVMVYSAWPGFTTSLDIRTSAAATGPWSPARRVELPECDDRIGSRTYLCWAAATQAWYTDGNAIGIGYYDSMIEQYPTRGAYRVARIEMPE